MIRQSDYISLGSKKTARWSRPPQRRSFGTRLVETLGKQLKGNVILTYEPNGVRLWARRAAVVVSVSSNSIT